MNASQAHARYAELNAVLDRAEHPAGTSTPITDDQLLGLQHRWSTALSARLDHAIESAGPEPLIDAVATGWRRLAAEHPTLRRVLDAGERSSPTVALAMAGEFRMLALAADIAGLDEAIEETVRLGRSYRDLIRSGRASLAPELNQVA